MGPIVPFNEVLICFFGVYWNGFSCFIVPKTHNFLFIFLQYIFFSFCVIRGRSDTVISQYPEEACCCPNKTCFVVLEKCFLLKRISPFRVNFELSWSLQIIFMLKQLHYSIRLSEIKLEK